MRGKTTVGVLGLGMVGFLLVQVGFTHIRQEKDLYVVVGRAEVVIALADGTETKNIEIMVAIKAAADQAATMTHLHAQLHQKFPPAQGYQNHQVVGVHKVRVELLEEVLATKQKPMAPFQFPRNL